MPSEHMKELLVSLERETVPSNACKLLEELGSFNKCGRPSPATLDRFEVDEIARDLYPHDADPDLLPVRVYGNRKSLSVCVADLLQ